VLLSLAIVFSARVVKAAPRQLVLQIHAVKSMDETTGV
jgi:hypothetical protein